MKRNSEIQFVYFDLDDTILDHTRAELFALRDLNNDSGSPLKGHSFELLHSHYREINPVVWKKYSSGEFTKKQAKVGRFTQLLDRLGVDPSGLDIELADEYLKRYSNHWKPIDGALEAFLKIAEHYQVGILTNGFSEIQRLKLEQFPELAASSDAVVISEEIGFLKPDTRLFDHAAAVVGMTSSQILYVGDSLHSDVGGGIASGWQVAWYSETEHDHQDVFSFSRWPQLLDKLDIG